MSNPSQRPQFSKKFAAGLLLGEGDMEGGPAIVLQISSDYDVLRTQLEQLLGRSFAPMTASPWGEGRCWAVSGSRQHEKVFEAFFKQATPPEAVRIKPSFSVLRLVPVDLDSPLIRNDWADVRHER